jgi:hypothetical protein
MTWPLFSADREGPLDERLEFRGRRANAKRHAT